MLNLEERRWPMVVMALILIGLVYNFLNTIFRSNIKRFSHDRIYVDYTTYKKPRSTTTDQSTYSPVFSARVAEAKRTLNDGRVEAAMNAYGSYMTERLANVELDPPPIKAKRVPEFEEMRALAANEVPEIEEAKRLYGMGRFDQAATILSELLNTLPENDLHHRSDSFDTLAECYFKLRNREGYVANKVKYLQCMRRLKPLLERAYPKLNHDGIGAWISAEEATQQLLRIRTLVGDPGGNPHKEAMVMRAEFDAEVARSVN